MAAAKKKSQGPAAPEPRSLVDELRALSEAQASSARAQAQATLDTNQGLIDQGFAAQTRQAGLLDNGYTAEARGAIRASLSDADILRDLGLGVDTGPTQIERALNDAALSELLLGGSLTPEQIRQSEQGSRAAFSARGMAIGKPAAIQEVLNRSSLSDARLADRRIFAADVNNTVSQNALARRSLVADLIGNAGNLSQAGAAGMVAIDPTQRAMGSPIPTGSVGAAAGLVGDAYRGILGYGADLNDTNLNLQASMYNSYKNNQAALKGAGIQAGASSAAGQSAMTGSALQAGGAVAGAAIGGIALVAF